MLGHGLPVKMKAVIRYIRNGKRFFGSAIHSSYLAQQVDGRAVGDNLLDSFEEGLALFSQQVDGRVVK